MLQIALYEVIVTRIHNFYFITFQILKCISYRTQWFLRSKSNTNVKKDKVVSGVCVYSKICQFRPQKSEKRSH